MESTTETQAPPARPKPPSALKIYLVLMGLILGSCLLCVLFTGFYAYYLDVRTRIREGALPPSAVVRLA